MTKSRFHLRTLWLIQVQPLHCKSKWKLEVSLLLGGKVLTQGDEEEEGDEEDYAGAAHYYASPATEHAFKAELNF